MEESFDLSPVFDLNMSPSEALAYQIGLYWMHYCRQVFPNYHHQKGFHIKGDPRKSNLFKYCYKLQKESQGIIKPEEYKIYIKAQLDMLKAINKNNDHPYIEPQILVGDKAWIRWKMWKRQYDAIYKKKITLTEAKLDTILLNDIKKELNQTKEFLLGRFEGEPKEEQIMMAHSDIGRWIALGKISPFYALLSPWVKKYVNIVNIDVLQYEKSITNEVTEHFNQLFHYEVSSK